MISTDKLIQFKKRANTTNMFYNPCTYQVGSQERLRLESVANMLNIFCNNHTFKVKETYFDFGQNWKWTTIICDDFQLLSPAMQQVLLVADYDVLADAIKELNLSIVEFDKKWGK